MTILIFCHSLLSDWNHGNAHFLRGIATELICRGNTVKVYEPKDAWSFHNLMAEHGQVVLDELKSYYPLLDSMQYDPAMLDLDEVLAEADLVLVHEWNDPVLVKAVGEKKKQYGFRLLFHDTHHRAVTERESMQAYDISAYDGVLAFGGMIRDIYQKEGWAKKAWTWHEAADTRIFHPYHRASFEGDLVWIGNWGDGERTRELFEYLIEPVKELNLKAKVYGVRYPERAKAALAEAGIEYGGWLPNFKVPEVFARYRFTVHVPRGPYVQALPGIPTIRPFEAIACGIPLISAPWQDRERLFTPGKDFIFTHGKEEMKRAIDCILTDEETAEALARHGLETIQSRHTCAHRVDELYRICEELGLIL